MTPSELKQHILEANPDSHFFDRKTMKFFGDTMRNYGVKLVTLWTSDQRAQLVWELYRKRAVKHGLKSSCYFDRTTYLKVHEDK